jgi:hypothetical protein
MQTLPSLDPALALDGASFASLYMRILFYIYSASSDTRVLHAIYYLLDMIYACANFRSWLSYNNRRVQ